MKKIKINKYKLIICINILFIIGCILFYGFRLIHYYRIENPKISKNDSFLEIVLAKNKPVTIGDGLYKDKESYIFKGKSINNYVKYSGRIWRIISIKDKNIKVISEDSQTSLVWGINDDYNNSYAKSWLNNSDNEIKSFYQSLDNTSILLDTETCIDVVDEEKDARCDRIVKDKVGLLSFYEYQSANGKDSYLNIGKYFWTSTINSSNDAWYVYSKGTLNNTVSSGNTYYSYGIRPTITINGEISIKGGNGSIDDPYNLEQETSNNLYNKYVGDYLLYSDYKWRIIEKDEKYVKIAMDGVIKEEEEYTTSFGTSNYLKSTTKIGKYLNETFYNKIDSKDYILKYQFNMGRYDKTYKYNFNKITEYKEEMNIGLLQLGELFINDVDNYFLATRTITSEGTIYEVLEDGKIYAGLTSDEKRLRPTLYLKPDIEIVEGSGTKKDPYKIG